MKIALDYSIVSFHCSDQDIKKIKGLQKKWKGSLMGWLCRNTSLNDKYKSTSKTLWQFVLCDLDYYHLFFDVQSDLEWNANIPPSVDPWIKLKRELQALAERRVFYLQLDLSSSSRCVRCWWFWKVSWMKESSHLRLQAKHNFFVIC